MKEIVLKRIKNDLEETDNFFDAEINNVLEIIDKHFDFCTNPSIKDLLLTIFYKTKKYIGLKIRKIFPIKVNKKEMEEIK